MKILLIEDDDLQADWLSGEIEHAFGSPPMLIATESDFRRRFDEIANWRPRVAVIDVMLRWTRPHRGMQGPTPEAQDIYTAGLRCRQWLAEHEATHQTPVIFYTVRNREDLEGEFHELPQPVTYLPKDSDAEPLLKLIRDVSRREYR